MECLHSIGAFPSSQTALHSLQSSSTPAYPAASGCLSDFSDSSTSDRSISGSCSVMSCAEKMLSLVSSFGFSNPSK